MKTTTILLICLFVLGLGLTTAAVDSQAKTALLGAVKVRPGAVRVQCSKPLSLRLIRFEDGSARLECAHRILVRVAVPG